MRKLYIVSPFIGDIEKGVYQLVTSDGLGLASHECSHSMNAPDALILKRPDRLEMWAEYLKDGYDVEFATMEKHQELFSMNQRQFNDPKNRELYMREVMKMKEEDIAALLTTNI